MASRPFASVDVALEVGAEQTDFLRGPLEVGTVVQRGPARFAYLYCLSNLHLLVKPLSLIIWG